VLGRNPQLSAKARFCKNTESLFVIIGEVANLIAMDCGKGRSFIAGKAHVPVMPHKGKSPFLHKDPGRRHYLGYRNVCYQCPQLAAVFDSGFQQAAPYTVASVCRFNGAIQDYPPYFHLALYFSIPHEKAVFLCNEDVLFWVAMRLSQTLLHMLQGGSLAQPVFLIYLIDQPNIGRNVVGSEISDDSQFASLWALPVQVSALL